MFDPIATYRLQFHKDFRFEDLRKIAGYLKKLSVGTVYASPVFYAVSGSTHGYDGLSPLMINPEIGTLEELEEISNLLHKDSIGWLQDIVPNHMAFHTCNKWLMDVLEKGAYSLFAPVFDTALTSRLLHGKIMIPFLSSSLHEAIEKKELQVGYEQRRFIFRYYDSFYPLQPGSYITLLSVLPDMPPVIKKLLANIPVPQPGQEQQYASEWNDLCEKLAALTQDEAVRAYIAQCLDHVNNDAALLQQLTGEQQYRLCHWQETDKHINYRRFFTVNGLICTNMQDDNVFTRYHSFIKEMVDKQIFNGLRVDHIDGLYDPQLYLEKLRAIAGRNTYIVVEKILQATETLPPDWPIEGNTGYDFLAVVNNLFTYAGSKKAFTAFYKELTGSKLDIAHLLAEKKRFILWEHMQGELENLCKMLEKIVMPETDKERKYLKILLAEILVHCPVYRYYGNKFPLAANEASALNAIIDKARKANRQLEKTVSRLKYALLEKPVSAGEEYNRQLAEWYQRCMQFTGPLMAKGMEDTLMYTWSRFIGHNDVGDDPASFGISPDMFHQWMEKRRQHTPLSINTTSTHDTKRGEDVRARLNVLTELPGEWIRTVTEWCNMNAHLKQNGMPDANDEYFIYQTITGAYPMPGGDVGDFLKRIQEYIPKALREAKRHSTWSSPNESYEQATMQFAKNILKDGSNFRESIDAWQQRITDFGIINSLSQLLLKCTCPGVPDIYQGTELWDLSLVDPDNRRAVDYTLRNDLLTSVTGMTVTELWNDRYNGGIKLWFTAKLLGLRRENTGVFRDGSYIPLIVKGQYKKHVLAFARRLGQIWYITAIPLHYALLCNNTNRTIKEVDWGDTHILLPDHVPTEWQHMLWPVAGSTGGKIMVKEIFSELPLALLKMETVTDRSAGVLLHITSLPSPFGIGDIGPGATAFADFLCCSCQKYWQLLPLNPIVAGNDFSPYSSISAMAGNELLISPELLMKAGLLDEETLQAHMLPQTAVTDFAGAAAHKHIIFEIAYKTFKSGNYTALLQQFDFFCEQEAEWLDDFALFTVLKKQYGNKHWITWPDAYRKRDPDVLQAFSNKHSDSLNYIKWLQFLFFRQWAELRTYCNRTGIQLFGDLPFYVSHDAADVWTNPGIFCLDETGAVKGIAGVPPDYFSADGQLWGMPTYNWNVLKKRGYDWWLKRLRKNMELFDLLRLDHFRAFAQYWEVPAGAMTARNGKWIDGPGKDFFDVVEQHLGHLPFVAEDLGDHMDAVYRLRDETGLPGMKVLQFAFGDHMAQSVDIPHNYTANCIVYTGTHDNNTTAGWFHDETNNADHKRLERYAGHKLKAGNVHHLMARIAYASVARIAILPMQDILGLKADSRMNMPGSGKGNWRWRLLPGQLQQALQKKLCAWAKMYNRL